jgi:hypothetical protein
VDNIPIANIVTLVTNDTLNSWYDENGDDEVTWEEWVSFQIDQRMWTLLDADSNDHITDVEFKAMGFSADHLIEWLDWPGNNDHLVNYAEWQAGCLKKNLYDKVAQSNLTDTEGQNDISKDEYAESDW